MWMLYAEQHWTKAIDLKLEVERLYEKLSALEFDADHEAIYGIESNSVTSSSSFDEEECKVVEQNGEGSETINEKESMKRKNERITKPDS
ncbi:hypothetical protein FQA39_LY16704 [Lamprigera yunnana]|nr:hypothetical protein FQA39_LY16704 [Lamprigera yunnana]